MTEFELKSRKIQDLMEHHHLGALLLRQVGSFAWATCGASSYVNTAATNGAASLLITPSGRYVITDNIEAGRLKQEEHLEEQEWEFRISPWYETNEAVTQLTHSLKFGADSPHPGAVDLSVEFSHMRSALGPEEGERFRKLSALCADAMDQAIRAVRPGMTEYQMAGILGNTVQQRGVQRYRHGYGRYELRLRRRNHHADSAARRAAADHRGVAGRRSGWRPPGL